MSRKLFLIPLLAIANSLIINHCLYAWAPFHRTLPIEGRITNKTTGEPIENVIIGAEWTKTIPALAVTMTRRMTGEAAVSDKEGKFSIPAKVTFHFPPLLIVGSWFDQMHIRIVHPLYESKELWNFHLKGNGKWIYREFVPEIQNYREIKPTEGKIQLDIQLLSLEEKYKKDIKPMASMEDKRKYAGGLSGFFGSFDNAFYWLNLKAKGIPYNIEEIFSRWDNIAGNVFGISDMKEYYMNNYKRDKEKMTIILSIHKNENIK